MNWFHIHWHKPAVRDGDYIGYECRCGHRTSDKPSLYSSPGVHMPSDLAFWVLKGWSEKISNLPRPRPAPRQRLDPNNPPRGHGSSVQQPQQHQSQRRLSNELMDDVIIKPPPQNRFPELKLVDD